MKKIFAILIAIFMMANVLCVTAFADAASDAVLRVSVLKMGADKPEVLNEYTSFEEGWNAAVSLAQNRETMKAQQYDRVVVDLLSSWVANAKYEFGDSDGVGFRQSTIHCPSKVRMTINLNGYTIDRGLYREGREKNKIDYDGEVIYIDTSADVIINDGTVKGGFSCNGAGGIHICSKASVVLNNVNVTENAVEDDKGAGIAVYSNATLIMNGGSISDNRLFVYFDTFQKTEGALYADDATVILNDVTISGNNANNGEAMGVAVSLNANSALTLNRCNIFDNCVKSDTPLHSLFYLDDSTCRLEIKDSSITGNGIASYSREKYSYSAMFASNGHLELNKCEIKNNTLCMLVDGARYRNGNNSFNDCTFTDNVAVVVGVAMTAKSSIHTFTNCRFNNNFPSESSPLVATASFNGSAYGRINLVDCDMGDSTYEDERYGDDRYIYFINSDENAGLEGSLFSNGSLAMTVALVAFVVALASFCMAIANKKKTASAAAANKE